MEKNAKRRSLTLISFFFQSIMNWSLEMSILFKIMNQLIIVLFFLDVLGLSIFGFIEDNVMQIINDVFQQDSDEEKIILVARIIESIKLDEKNEAHLKGVKIALT